MNNSSLVFFGWMLFGFIAGQFSFLPIVLAALISLTVVVVALDWFNAVKEP